MSKNYTFEKSNPKKLAYLLWGSLSFVFSLALFFSGVTNAVTGLSLDDEMPLSSSLNHIREKSQEHDRCSVSVQPTDQQDLFNKDRSSISLAQETLHFKQQLEEIFNSKEWQEKIKAGRLETDYENIEKTAIVTAGILFGTSLAYIFPFPKDVLEELAQNSSMPKFCFKLMHIVCMATGGISVFDFCFRSLKDYPAICRFKQSIKNMLKRDN